MATDIPEKKLQLAFGRWFAGMKKSWKCTLKFFVKTSGIWKTQWLDCAVRLSSMVCKKNGVIFLTDELLRTGYATSL